MAWIIAAFYLFLLVHPANAASPEASAHSIAVFNLANANDYRGAIALHESNFEKYKSDLIENNNYTFAVALAYKGLGDYARALEFYKLSLNADHDPYARPVLLEYIAEAQLHLGALDEAQANYKQALDLRIATPGVDKNDSNAAEMRAGLTRVALQRGDWSVALKGLQEQAVKYETTAGPGIIKGNPFADQGYEDWFKTNQWVYEGIAKSAWELAKVQGSDQAGLREIGFDAVQWLQRSTASEAMAQTVARISAADTGANGTLRTIQDWRNLFKKANEDQWSGKGLAKYRQQLAESPDFQAELQRVRQEYEKRLAQSDAAKSGERAQQRNVEAARAAGEQAVSADRALRCHFMDEREECKRLRAQAMTAVAPLTTDYLAIERQQQATAHAKEKLDELEQATKDDTNFLLWLERKIQPHLDAALADTDPDAVKFMPDIPALTPKEENHDADSAKQALRVESLTDRAPLKEAEVTALLGNSKAMVIFLIGEQQSFAWAVTSQGASWSSIPINHHTLEEDLAILRCGLDDASSDKCASSLGLDHSPGENDPLPFSFAIAHDLYVKLFGPLEGVLKGKDLIIVPSGALLSLPFQVLMPDAPSKPVGTMYADYAGIAWFGRSHVISVLPSVPSLKLLTNYAPKNRGSEPYMGFGDPLLKGNKNCPESSPADLQSYCGALDEADKLGGETKRSRTRIASRSPGLGDVFQRKQLSSRGVAEVVNKLCPLPETAGELKCVAKLMRVPESELRLSSTATEAELKSMSTSGALARYRLVHFATHGLLSGDVEEMAGRRAEPALVMTPPSVPQNDDDDGLLTASEITQLKFNADLIILSACNTAAGQDAHADALSGLARAFFYAGTRSLLVSNWPVVSDVAARLVAETFHIVEASGGKISYPEALAKATAEVIDDSSSVDNMHPSVWAPFVFIGLG